MVHVGSTQPHLVEVGSLGRDAAEGDVHGTSGAPGHDVGVERARDGARLARVGRVARLVRVGVAEKAPTTCTGQALATTTHRDRRAECVWGGARTHEHWPLEQEPTGQPPKLHGYVWAVEDAFTSYWLFGAAVMQPWQPLVGMFSVNEPLSMATGNFCGGVPTWKSVAQQHRGASTQAPAHSGCAYSTVGPVREHLPERHEPHAARPVAHSKLSPSPCSSDAHAR